MSVAAFHRAVLAGDVGSVRALLDEDPSLVASVAPEEVAPEALGRGRGGNTALHLAAFTGKAEFEELLCERGADPAATNAEGRTALHVALEHDNRTREKLVELGCPLDVVAAACMHRHDELTAMLRDDPSLANDVSTQLGPLGWATYHGAKRSAGILLDHGARMDDGELFCAAGVGSVEMAAFLVERGADVNEADEAGVTALHVAACHRYTHDAEPLVRWLLARGADARARTRNGKTALDLALDSERRQAEGDVRAGHPAHCNFAGVIAALREHP